MSRRRELEQHLRHLGEIGEIMRSMKNLALMETRKLARFLDAQDQSVRCIESVATDFLTFHAHTVPDLRPVKQVILLIGSERGFCGDFNEELLGELAARQSADISSHPGECSQDLPLLVEECSLIAVGSKLCSRLEKRFPTADLVDGPTVAEEVSETLNRLVVAIRQLQPHGGTMVLTVLHHRSGEAGVSRKPLLPPFTQLAQGDPKFGHPPLLNLSPAPFFAELMEHYLFAALHEILYNSLMAENQRRIQHIEGAIQRLDEKIADFGRHFRTLRQEEITEEIEVILLSAEGLGT